ncbi:MAG: MaoC family dehydratase [Deltaproteobacteria bacterium]|nr:MaoC family dehydratase [Deltaproteobacteria bacterium]MBW2415042.1 MaoC family dehydratase [Deltaproteobacteria bacterium]
MGNVEQAAEIFGKTVGNEEEPGSWHKVEQAQINLFADATGDHQFIHVDPEKAKQTPFGTTVAHGFLTLSLLPFLQATIPAGDPAAYQGLMMGVNYGLNRVRFPNPVKVDSKVRAKRVLTAVDAVAPNALQLTQTVTIEIEGEAKPACVAEFLTRLMYA